MRISVPVMSSFPFREASSLTQYKQTNKQTNKPSPGCDDPQSRTWFNKTSILRPFSILFLHLLSFYPLWVFICQQTVALNVKSFLFAANLHSQRQTKSRRALKLLLRLNPGSGSSEGLGLCGSFRDHLNFLSRC